MINKVLIFRTDRIGDLIFTCPTIISIKKYFKECEITLITSSKNYEYAKSLNPNDEVIEDKGVKVFIDAGAVMYLLGTEMDYRKEEFSSSFVFKNPNETERCGCGESFKI